MESYFIGVDVGSGSARAALVSKNGRILKTSVKKIKVWKPAFDYFEHSSEDIWAAVVSVVKAVLIEADPKKVKGIGFDATCSLVILDKDARPLTVSHSGNHDQNIIMWMDHRASHEASTINATKHPLLKYVGGKVSLEMEMPKLLWLKNNIATTWQKLGHAFDLPDFLTFRATGNTSRSLCSLVCKCNFEYSITGKKGWNQDFLEKIGLSDLGDDNYAKIGQQFLQPGTPVSGGLSKTAAKEFGLPEGTPVAASIIDAHAGGLGMIGTNAPGISQEMSSRLSLICGTSTCHMAISKEPVMVEGVWGPFYSAMVPDMWLSEAGQSASGMLLDFVINTHPASKELLQSLETGEIRQHLRTILQKMANHKCLENVSFLTRTLHMWPDYHGNRSPLADPTMKGSIVGLTLDSSEENLALHYLAALQALAYGTRHIMDALVTSGHEPFKSLLICGGLSQDPLFVQIQADVVALPVLKPIESESVLLGSAILGANASKLFPTVNDAIREMGGSANVIRPDLTTKSYHDKKYAVFLKMYNDQLEYRRIMSE